MSLKYKVGDITLAPEEIIGHGCNCQGVMGSGVAKDIRVEYPDAYKLYRAQYEKSGLQLGTVLCVICTGKTLPNTPRIIANCMTQEFYGRDPLKQYCDYEAIRSCMKHINDYYKHNDYSLALPKIGCGLGGGNWDTVSKIIEEEITNLDVTIYVLDENEIPKGINVRSDNPKQPDKQ